MTLHSARYNKWILNCTPALRNRIREDRENLFLCQDGALTGGIMVGGMVFYLEYLVQIKYHLNVTKLRLSQTVSIIKKLTLSRLYDAVSNDQRQMAAHEHGAFHRAPYRLNQAGLKSLLSRAFNFLFVHLMFLHVIR